MADRQPRGPSGLPVLGSSLDFSADPLGFVVRQRERSESDRDLFSLLFCAQESETADVGQRVELDYAGRGEPELIPTVTLHPEPPMEFDVRTR